MTVPVSLLANLGASGGFGAGVTNVASKTVSGWRMSFQATTLKDHGPATFVD